jgi:hypothetical protein
MRLIGSGRPATVLKFVLARLSRPQLVAAPRSSPGFARAFVSVSNLASTPTGVRIGVDVEREANSDVPGPRREIDLEQSGHGVGGRPLVRYAVARARARARAGGEVRRGRERELGGRDGNKQ